MGLIQAIIISLLQGISELFPISSLGHAVLVPKLLHWNLDEQSPNWLAFLVALHIGTAAALLIYFRNEWIGVIRAFVSSIRRGQMGQDHDERLAWMVVLGTIPAGLVGFALEHPLRSLFASPYIAASALIVNGLIMYIGERLLQRRERALPVAATVYSGRVSTNTALIAHPQARNTASALDRLDRIERYRDITELSWRDAAVVGFAQIGALIPGISRSGVTMVAGLAAGLTHEAAARYAFLLATPIIGAAGLLELPNLFSPGGRSVLSDALVGLILAGVAAYLSVRFLMHYFEFGRLHPFAYYCWAAGIFSLAVLSLH
jgi:undecaprenyl-diphosphatase